MIDLIKMILDEILSTFFQLLLFAGIPFIFYLFASNRYTNFFSYIGLNSANRKGIYISVFISLMIASPLIILSIINKDIKEIFLDPNSVTGKIHEIGFGFESIFLILILAIFKTALSEEILFRGFITKRLINLTSFKVGISIQALLFGLIHVLFLFAININIGFVLIVFIFLTFAAYMMAYVNEEVAEGSIIPGWIAHATGNLLSYSIIGLFL